jgi:hypothetical protein
VSVHEVNGKQSDKLALAILLMGVAAFIVTTMALLMAAGLLVL